MLVGEGRGGVLGSMREGRGGERVGEEGWGRGEEKGEGGASVRGGESCLVSSVAVPHALCAQM